MAGTGVRDRSVLLVVRLVADFPNNMPSGPGVGSYVMAADRMLDDFAAEVVADTAKAPAQTSVGLCYVLDASEGTYCLRLRPNLYSLSVRNAPTTLHRSSAIRPVVNRLRIEVRGDTMRVLINDQPVDQMSMPGLDRRRGRLAIYIAGLGPTPDRTVEVRLRDLRVYRLTS